MTSIFELSSRLHYGTVKRSRFLELSTRGTAHILDSCKQQRTTQRATQTKQETLVPSSSSPNVPYTHKQPSKARESETCIKKKQQMWRTINSSALSVCVCVYVRAKNPKKCPTGWWQQVQLKYITAEVWHPTTWQKKIHRKDDNKSTVPAEEP